MNGEPHKLKLYNLPQRVEGGIKIHGCKDHDTDEYITVLFHNLDGMYANCTAEDTGNPVTLSATTPLIEMGNDEYKIDEEEAQEREY